jgi:hypothetical protein
LAPRNKFASRSVNDRRLESDNLLPLFDGSLGNHPNQGLGVDKVRVRNGTNRAVKGAFFVPAMPAGSATSSRTIAQNSPQIGTTMGTYTPPPGCYSDPGNRFRVTAADGSGNTSYACPPGWSAPPTNDPADTPNVPLSLFAERTATGDLFDVRTRRRRRLAEQATRERSIRKAPDAGALGPPRAPGPKAGRLRVRGVGEVPRGCPPRPCT